MKKLIPLFLLIAFSFSKSIFAAEAVAMIQGTEENSKLTGTANLTDTERGLEVKVEISNAPPGLHGIHIHENGSCADKGNAAGSHYNPNDVKHGLVITEGLEGAHAGDFGNIKIAENGRGNISLTIPGLTISGGTHNVENRALILHEKEDDFGQPTGNAGGRIGCGIIEVDEKNPAA